MRVKRYISIILISFMFYLISGCSNKNIQVSSNPENNKKVEASINSDINSYSPIMSSTPGIPLNVKLKPSANKDNIKFHWVTEQGTFLNWQQNNGKVDILGSDVKSNEQKIYWSINPNEKINKSPFKIYLKIEENDSSKILYETSIELEQNKEGYFSVKR